MFKTPILFLVFNRPNTTERVFEKIKEVKPARLYLAADGPRKDRPAEAVLCQDVRDKVLKNIDWECEVHTLLRQENLGCKEAVSSAISWFFENEEEGIVLEDDTLPSMSFFRFSEEMLEKYRHNEKVTAISALNFLGEYCPDNSDYFFSKVIGIWGWASWRRAWKAYEVNMPSWGDKQVKKQVASHLQNTMWFRQYSLIFDMMYKRTYDTWDFQWIYTQLLLGGLVVIPAKNLVKNIGFGPEGSHTNNPNDVLASLLNMELNFPLKGPSLEIADFYYDEYYFKNYVPYPKSWLKSSTEFLQQKFSNGMIRLKRLFNSKI